MNLKEKLKSKVSTIIDDMIDVELCKWPPQCVGIVYQPARPEKIQKEEQDI